MAPAASGAVTRDHLLISRIALTPFQNRLLIADHYALSRLPRRTRNSKPWLVESSDAQKYRLR